MKKRFVSVYFPHLATDWFELRKPELRSFPFVLTTASRGRLVITAANPAAQKKGLCEGMVLADARAIVPSLQVFEDKPTLVPQLLQRSAEWFIRFSPVAAAQPPDGVVIDATGCAHLWGSEEAYVGDMLKRLKAKGYAAKVAMADTIGAAWALARYQNQAAVVTEGSPTEALWHLPPAALRLGIETTELLHGLGLTQIKDVINLPRSALRRRFGKELLLRMDQALGNEEEGFHPVYPPEPYQERLPSPEPIVTRSGIEIALQRLLEPLCHRLKGESAGLREVVFRCYRTDSTAQGIQVTTSRPSHNPLHLLHLFLFKLSIVEPKEGIELFMLEASKVEKVSPVQEAFWKERGGFNHQPVSELIDRIAGKLGAEHIYRCLPDEHWWPERSVKKTTSLDEKATSEWKTDKPRPVQVLSPPQKIEVTAPVPDYPPMNFRYRGKVHKIVNADGPERIEQEWWIEEGEHRDYYAVEDEDGQRYWVFRLGHFTGDKSHQWFLHGFFA